MNTRLSITLVALLSGLSTVAQTTINTTNRLAYGANLGWLDFRADGLNGLAMGDYVCSGFIYAANVGWINLGNGHPTNGLRYQNTSAADFGINHDGRGNLRGSAYSANVGWITFGDRGGPAVDLRTGIFSGFIYSANAGWISLSNAVAFVQTDTIAPGVDTDADGIPDAYEILWTGGLTRMNGTSDLDGDGAPDLQEFIADTNPLDAADNFRISTFGFGSNGTTASVSWTSQPTRFYRLQKRVDFSPGSSWIDSGLGLISPDAGPVTTRALEDSPSSERFLRIEAVRPLSP